jgi:hypothetical protein
MNNVPIFLFSTAIAFAAAGLGVIVTQGQATWVPANRWLAPLLFMVAVMLLLWALALRNGSAGFNDGPGAEPRRISAIYHKRRMEPTVRP